MRLILDNKECAIAISEYVDTLGFKINPTQMFKCVVLADGTIEISVGIIVDEEEEEDKDNDTRNTNEGTGRDGIDYAVGGEGKGEE